MKATKLTKEELIKSFERTSALNVEVKNKIETLTLKETLECYSIYINQFEYLSRLKNDYEDLESSFLEDINNKLALCTIVINAVNDRLEKLKEEYHFAYPMFPKINGVYPY